MATLVSEQSRLLIRVMLTDPAIAAKVFENANDKEKYKICTICDTGTVVMGKTSFTWWNKLLNCQDKLPFESLALKIWDALVDLSSGMNNVAIQKGLSQEIIQGSIRRKEYDDVIHRLYDCFSHVAQKSTGYQTPKTETESPEGSQRTVIVEKPTEPQQIVINVQGKPHYIPFKDSIGDPFNIALEVGITGVKKVFLYLMCASMSSFLRDDYSRIKTLENQTVYRKINVLGIIRNHKTIEFVVRYIERSFMRERLLTDCFTLISYMYLIVHTRTTHRLMISNSITLCLT